MTDTMYDSTNATAIPTDAKVAAGYVDGDFVSYPEIVAALPDAEVVGITVTGTEGARVCDVEKGNLSPKGGANWAKNEIAAGRRPTLYYSLDSQDDVTAALTAAGITVEEVDHWVADWTYEAHLVTGSVATQWANPPQSGGDYDVSELAPGWPSAAPEPEPTPQPVPEPTPAPTPVEDDVQVTEIQSGSTGAPVSNAQALLVQHGLSIAVDGIFGPITQGAVQSFQETHGLAIDGIVGPLTWGALVND